MAGLFPIIAVLGFTSGYQAIHQGSLHVHLVVHIDGALIISWLLFFLKAILAAKGNFKFYRSLGLSSVLLGGDCLDIYVDDKHSCAHSKSSSGRKFPVRSYLNETLCHYHICIVLLMGHAHKKKRFHRTQASSFPGHCCVTADCHWTYALVTHVWIGLSVYFFYLSRHAVNSAFHLWPAHLKIYS